MCNDTQHSETLAALTAIKELLTRQGPDYDTVAVSDTRSFTVDYRGRRYLYLWTDSALTFVVVGTGGTFRVPAASWYQLAFPESTLIATSGQASAKQISLLATNNLLDALTINANVIPATNNASVPTGAANTVIKASAGSITSIVVTTTGTGSGNAVLYDNATTNSGTPLAIVAANASAGTQYQVNGWAKNGIVAQNVANGPVFTVFFS